MKNNNSTSLTWEENIYLFRELKKGNMLVREKIIKGNLNLVYAVMRKNKYKYDEDLFQEGLIGLIKAVDTFNVNRGTKFSTYAFKYILTGIRNATDKINSEKLHNKILLYIEEYYKKAGLKPTNKEISIAFDIDESKINYLLGMNFEELSIDKVINNSSNCLSELLSSKENIEKEVLDKIYIREALDILPMRNREIVKMYYGIDYPYPINMVEIGMKLGITRQGVSIILLNSIEKIRNSSTCKIKSVSMKAK